MIDILSVREHEHQEFNNLDLKQSSLSQVEFNKCSFTRCNFSQSTLIECRFYDCTFRACDLSLVKLNGSYVRDSKFISCKLVGINWLEASKQFSADFEDCMLNLSSFFGMNLKRRKIKGCVANEVDFSESNMTECDCSNTDFAKSTFSQTNLTKANFSGAKNYLIDFRTNNLTKTKFSLPEAISLLDVLDIIITD
jgi:fluoroquinolone resistance protein